MNIKKIIKRAILGLTITGVIAGGAGGGIYYIRHNSSRSVEIYPLSALNTAEWAHWEDEEGASGTVQSDVSQRITISPEQFIDEVFVEMGQKVKVGDKLMSFDTTLLELDQELQELTVTRQDIELKAARKDLEKLKNTTPIVRQERDDDDDYSMYGSYYGNDDDILDALDYEDARMLSNDRDLMAVSDEKEEIELPETEEIIIEDTEEPEAAQEEDIELPGETESEVADTEQILGEDDNVNVDVFELSPDKKDSDSLIKKEAEKEKEAESQRNLSLAPFLKNIRIKSVTENGQELLLDTNYEEYGKIDVTTDLNLVPHFCENGENHFVKNGTYVMTIQGLNLQKSRSGKVYGTAVIVSGEDYPEIGGYTLAMDKKKENTAILTIAFHDGLEAEHATDPVLDDMYVELLLKQKEVLPGSLTLFASEEEPLQRKFEINNDIFDNEPEVELEEDTVEEENESGIETDMTETEPEDQDVISEDITEPESSSTPETGSQEEETENVEETEQETEQESETDSLPENPSTSEKANFIVRWSHGTNSSLRWPDSVKLFFYADEEEDAQWSLSLSQNGVIRIDAATGESGEDFDGSESDEAEDESNEIDEIEENISDKAEVSEVIPDPDEIEDDTKETWDRMTINWPQGSSFAVGQEARVWAYAENYMGNVVYDSMTGTYEISMTYREPIDSPLLLLEPIENLSYIHGANTIAGTGMRAYRGSGTQEDPYVFLVKDGVRIESSFANWVLGFDELGLTRLHEGYVVRLEIREDDSLEGVFIRCIEMDGRVQAEYGYPPTVYWIFNSTSGITQFEDEIDEPDFPDDYGFPDDSWIDDDGEGYTAEELENAIREKELEIRKMELEQREAELKLKKYNKQMEESTVCSAVNGVVARIGQGDYDDAYMIVNSENSLYIKTSISELELDSIKVGDEISCSSWETGSKFKAKITKIDTVPSAGQEYMSFNENPNSSSYPVLAVVEGDKELQEYDYVQVKYTTKKKKYSDIYLDKAYVRSENGKSYVYIKGPDDKLKKQYVKTGENSYGSVEIKAGLNLEDYIAFPYNKNAKEGAATRISRAYED